MKRKLSPPPLRPRSKLGSWGTNKIYYIGIPIQKVTNKIKSLHGIQTGSPMQITLGPQYNVGEKQKNQNTPRPSEHPPVMGEKNI